LKQVIKLIKSLRNTIRTGWMQKGVPPSLGETIVEHSFMSSIISLYLCSELKGCNAEKACVLSLLHDFPEAIEGDLNKFVSLRIGKEKREIEDEIVNNYFPKWMGNFIKMTWEGSIEAKISRLADRLATIIMANEYIRLGFNDVGEIRETYLKEVEDLLKEDILRNISGKVKELIEL